MQAFWLADGIECSALRQVWEIVSTWNMMFQTMCLGGLTDIVQMIMKLASRIGAMPRLHHCFQRWETLKACLLRAGHDLWHP